MRVFADTANPTWNKNGKYNKENSDDLRAARENEGYDDEYDYQDEDYQDADYDDEEYQDEEYDEDEYEDEQYQDDEYDEEYEEEYNDGDSDNDEHASNLAPGAFTVVEDAELGNADETGTAVDGGGFAAQRDEVNISRKKKITTRNNKSRLIAQVDVIREVLQGQQQIARSVKNGDTLNEDDNYKIEVSCTRTCYAYIAQLDASGKLDPIFPSNFVELENPLTRSTPYSIPTGNNWFYLDSNKGIEQIYFIISKTPRQDIENIFTKLSVANKDLVKKADVSVNQPLILTRGIAGVRKGKARPIAMRNGRQGSYVSTLMKSINADLVITRWFNHE